MPGHVVTVKQRTAFGVDQDQICVRRLPLPQHEFPRQPDPVRRNWKVDQARFDVSGEGLGPALIAENMTLAPASRLFTQPQSAFDLRAGELGALAQRFDGRKSWPD